jgi:hypothetical protein
LRARSRDLLPRASFSIFSNTERPERADLQTDRSALGGPKAVVEAEVVGDLDQVALPGHDRYRERFVEPVRTFMPLPSLKTIKLLLNRSVNWFSGVLACPTG